MLCVTVLLSTCLCTTVSHSLAKSTLEYIINRGTSFFPGVVGNDVCYGKAISACGNGGEWDLAMEIFDSLEDRGLSPGAVSKSHTL